MICHKGIRGSGCREWRLTGLSPSGGYLFSRRTRATPNHADCPTPRRPCISPSVDCGVHRRDIDRTRRHSFPCRIRFGNGFRVVVDSSERLGYGHSNRAATPTLRRGDIRRMDLLVAIFRPPRAPLRNREPRGVLCADLHVCPKPTSDFFSVG